MKVAISTRKGKNIIFDVTPNDLVEILKDKLSKAEEIPIENQHLIFECLTLQNGHRLGEYDIQNGSIILLVNTKYSLLLKSSIIFPNSTLIDRILQSLIDLGNNTQVKDAINLLVEAISYLDERLDAKTTNEVFDLILSCFSHFPEDSLRTYQLRLSKPTLTVLHIVLTSSILEYLDNKYPNIPLNDYNEFITNAFKDILPQVQSGNINNLQVFGFNIPPEFCKMFIFNIVLLMDLTGPIVSTFYPLFFAKPINFEKFTVFIQKVSKLGLINIIREETFLQDDLYLNLNADGLAALIQKLSKPNFEKVLPNIEKNIRKFGQITSQFSNSLINKCIECDSKTKLFGFVLDQITDFSSPKFWDFIDKNKISVSPTLWQNFTEYAAKRSNQTGQPASSFLPRNPNVLKLIPSTGDLPYEYIVYCLNNSDDLEAYDQLIQRINNSRSDSAFKSTDFWVHILKLVSDSGKQCPDRIVRSFSQVFTNKYQRNEANKALDEIIFKDFPLNKWKSKFMCDFIQRMPSSYSDQFHNQEHSKTQLTRIISQGKIPCPECCRIFDLNCINQLPQLTPALLYMYEFSYSNQHPSFLQTIEVIPFSRPADLSLIKFIKENNNYDLINDLDEISLSLVSCALYITNSPRALQVLGLNIDNVLPFFAVSLNYLNETNNGDLARSTNSSIFDLLIEACRKFDADPSPLCIASVDSIVSKFPNLLNNSRFPNSRAYQMADIFTDFLIHDKYKGDKALLMASLFRLTSQERSITPFKSQSRLSIEFFVNNLPLIKGNEKFKDLTLNLNMFNSNETSKSFVDIITNATSYEPIAQAITLYSKYCRNKPSLTFLSTQNVTQAYQKAAFDNDWETVSNIAQLMRNCNIPINNSLLSGKQIPPEMSKSIYKSAKASSIDEIISIILSEAKPEEMTQPFVTLYKLLMANQSTSVKYINACLERYHIVIDPDRIQTKLSNLIHDYSGNFIYTLDHYYFYLNDRDKFVRKYKISPLDLPEPDFKFLQRLVEDKSFQSFVCLQNIASAFPFFFEPPNVEGRHPLFTVELVLPTLNCIPILFDCKEGNEDLIVELKRAFAALYFLFACLNSTRFMSEFVLWLFESISKLTEPQVFCMLNILQSLFNTNSIKNIVFAYALKYDFFNTISSLLNRKMPECKFKDYYYKTLYEVALSFVDLFRNYHNYGQVLLLEQIINGSIKKPFENQLFNYTTTTYSQLSQLNISFPHENEFPSKIYSFINNLTQIKSFWLLNENKNDSNNGPNYVPSSGTIPFGLKMKGPGKGNRTKIVSEYIKSGKNRLNSSLNVNIPQIIRPVSIKMRRYLLTEPRWAVDYADDNNSTAFIGVPEYKDYLVNVINKMNQIYRDSNKIPTDSSAPKDPENDQYQKIINAYDYFSSKIDCKSFFIELIKVAVNVGIIDDSNNNKNNNNNNNNNWNNNNNRNNNNRNNNNRSNNSNNNKESPLYQLINRVTYNEKDLLTFLHYISDFVSQDESFFLSSPQLLLKVSKLIIELYKNNHKLEQSLIKTCGSRLIELALSDSFRKNSEFVGIVSTLLTIVTCELPISVTHLIGIIFMYHPSLTKKGCQLYNKLGEDKAKNIMPTIQTRYIKQIERKEPDVNQIKLYLTNVPILARTCPQPTIKFLNELIEKHKNNYQDSQTCGLIIELFNKLAPERGLHKGSKSNSKDEIDVDFTITPPAQRQQQERIYQVAMQDSNSNSSSSSSNNNNNSNHDFFRNHSLFGRLNRINNINNNNNNNNNNDNNPPTFQPAPSYLKEKDPYFWENAYEKNRPFLNELMRRDNSLMDKLDFVVIYNELLSFKQRLNWFRRNMRNFKNGNSINLRISHENILVDTFSLWSQRPSREFLGHISISYTGENGSDGGGLTRDWLTNISKELFDPTLGIFMKTDNNSYFPNPSAHLNCLNIQCMKMAGGIIAVSMARHEYINAHLSLPLLRQLLKQPLKLEDLEDFDKQLFTSLKSILDTEDVTPLDLVFSIDVMQNGALKSINLKENGDKIPVTNENKFEYVKLYINHRIHGSVRELIDAFCDGFKAIVDLKHIRMFSPKELDLMICGNQNIDIDDLKRNVSYRGPYSEKHNVIQLFFKLLRKWSQEDLHYLLKFVTGSSQIGINGFSEYREKGNSFVIAPGGSKERLPVSHTCSYTLDLPEYDNEKDMNDKLLAAIRETQFGLA